MKKFVVSRMQLSPIIARVKTNCLTGGFFFVRKLKSE
jgi:hypothetical protein